MLHKTKNTSKKPAGPVFSRKGLSFNEKYGQKVKQKAKSSSGISNKKHERYSKQPIMSLDVSKNPIGYLRSQTPSYKKYLNAHLQNNFTYATQTTLGIASGVGRQRANKLHKWIVLDGILHTQHRGVQRTNCSWINPQFKRVILQPWVRRRVQGFLPVLYMDPPFEKSLLYSVKNTEATQVNILNISHDISLSPNTKFKKSSSIIAEVVPRANEGSSMSIPSYIEAVKSILLTDLGKAKLAKYNQIAIEYADRQIQKRSNIAYPFNYFENLAKRSHEEESAVVNYKAATDLIALLPAGLVKNLVENKIVAHDFPPKRSQSGATGRISNKTLKENESASRFTGSSNDISGWWKVTLELRQSNHDLYIERIQQRRHAYEERHGFTHVDGPVTPYWNLWCGSPDGLYYNELEKENESNNGVSFQRFIEGPIGQQFYKSAHPKVKSILGPLFKKMFHVEEFTALLVDKRNDEPSATSDIQTRNGMDVLTKVLNTAQNQTETNVIESIELVNEREINVEEEPIWEEVYD